MDLSYYIQKNVAKLLALIDDDSDEYKSLQLITFNYKNKTEQQIADAFIVLKEQKKISSHP